ncbi:MAG: hypothetical protein HY422_00925 [Candidatus Komeilibacteria bacterium]|nr:hypothetical protein [Candidatus Komeilibacteria bacterium]
MSGTAFLSGVYYGKYEKVVHLVISGSMTVFFYMLFGLAWALTVPLVVGVAKELRDARRLDDHFDLFDMLANVAGISISFVFIRLTGNGGYV